MRDEIFERKTLEFKASSIIFEGEMTLLRGSDEDKGYTVDIAMPWGAVYNISSHSDRVTAQIAFHKNYQELFNQGYGVRLISPARAQIVKGNR